MMLTKLNEAISLIDDRYLDMVDSEEKELINMSETRKTRPIRKRVFTVLIAAVVVLFGCFTTAFALNEDFRVAVLSFFKIHAEDKVEQVPVENEPLHLESEDISGQIETTATVSRVCVPNNGHASNGLFYVCTDENEYNSGSRYDIYDLDKGELVLLKKNEFSAICRIDGKDYPIQLEWAENGSSIGIGYVGGPELTDGSSTDGSYIVCQTLYAGGPKALLLLNEADANNRPIIADLVNNTATPVKAAFIDNISTAEISENGAMLLLRTLDPDGKYYCADIASEKVCCLNDLCDSYLVDCRFASDSQLVCWAVSGGMTDIAMEELLAQQAAGQQSDTTVPDLGTVSVWIVTPGTETVKAVLTDKPATKYTNINALALGEDDPSNCCGIVCVSGRYAVEINAEGALIIYDLLEGAQTASDNLTLQDTKSTDIVVNPDGTKLLFIKRNNSDGTLVKLSVLDMEKTSFVVIDRDPAAVGNEHLVDWFDRETVLVDNNTYDASDNNTGDSWCYLYRVRN